MSTFPGVMPEIPGISVDRFDGVNMKSSVFFLSHCHTDHMVGLSRQEFQDKLHLDNNFLYLSAVSAIILRKTYPELGSRLRILDKSMSTTIDLSSGNYLEVFAIPAGHCPGSVMFLFLYYASGRERTVLYTGDYRINRNDIHKFKAFYNSSGLKRVIHKIYLDTTFFLKAYEEFPLREDSLNEICTIITNWITKSDRHLIRLSTSAKYGYEYLFIEISKKLEMPVHVNEDIYRFYARVPEMDEAITLDGQSTQIHCSCGLTDWRAICAEEELSKYPRPRLIKSIRISAIRWRNYGEENNEMSEFDQGIHYVCYSTHASFSEGLALIKFLEPLEVQPSVLYAGNDDNNLEIYRNIRNVVGSPVKSKVRPSNKKKVRLFNIDNNSGAGTSNGVKLEEVESDILDSPPRRKRF